MALDLTEDEVLRVQLQHIGLTPDPGPSFTNPTTLSAFESDVSSPSIELLTAVSLVDAESITSILGYLRTPPVSALSGSRISL